MAFKIAIARRRATPIAPLAAGRTAWHRPAMPDFVIERRCRGIVCGIDEAGRGPLAGPVVAAAVILERHRFPKILRQELDDSKVLPPDRRAGCYAALWRCAGRGAARI